MNKVKKLIIGLVMGTAFLGVIAYAGYLFFVSDVSSSIEKVEGAVGDTSKGQKSQEEEPEDYITYQGIKYEYNKNLKNILFLGIDKTEDVSLENQSGWGGQSDTILVFVMDTEKKTTKILEISRDTMTDIDVYDVNGQYFSTTQAQIGLQYAYGRGGKKSCQFAKQAVEHFLYNVKMDSYISMNVEGIAAITDAVGGVTLTVPEDYTNIDKSFKEGAVITLDGKMAEKYVRSRELDVTGSNNQRMDRQNQFMKAFIAQLKQTGQKDANTVGALMTSAQDYMITDMDAETLKTLAQYDLDMEAALKVPGEVREGEYHDEFHVDNEKMHELILELFYKPI